MFRAAGPIPAGATSPTSDAETCTNSSIPQPQALGRVGLEHDRGTQVVNRLIVKAATIQSGRAWRAPAEVARS